MFSTHGLNQLSTPRVTRMPKKKATISAGKKAAAANRATKRRCSRAPASPVCSRASFTTRHAISPPSPRMTTKLIPSRVSTSGLAGPSGPARLGDEPRPTAAAARLAETAKPPHRNGRVSSLSSQPRPSDRLGRRDRAESDSICENLGLTVPQFQQPCGGNTSAAAAGHRNAELLDFLAQGVAVQAEHLGRADLVAPGGRQRELDQRTLDVFEHPVIEADRRHAVRLVGEV